MVTKITSKQLKPVLMNPKARGIKEPYFLLEDAEQVVYILSQGQNGSEFNKTLGFINNYPGVKITTCLYGQGVLVMQRNDDEGEVKEFKVVTLTPGRQVEVPSLWATCLINIGRIFLIVIESGARDPKYQNTKPIIEKRGFAYYIVEKKGEISFEPNLNYSVHPQITTQ